MDRATTRTNALTGRSLRLCNAFLHLIVIVIASKLTPSHAAAVFAIATVLAQLLAGSGSDEDVLATIVRLAIDSVGVSITVRNDATYRVQYAGSGRLQAGQHCQHCLCP